MHAAAGETGSGSATGDRAILRARGVEKSFMTPRGPLRVLAGVDLEVGSGESVAIVGASGVGKSTLLHVLGALDRPTGGQVVIGGQSLFDLDDAALAAFRNRTVGFVFQFHHLLSEFTAVENVMMPGLISGLGLGQARERAMELLEAVGLGRWAEHRPGELSGGEQQRVAVVRALMNAPRLLLADEPSGNLDRDSAHDLHRLLDDLRRRQGVSLVIVTHDLELARRADRVFRLADGVAGPVEL